MFLAGFQRELEVKRRKKTQKAGNSKSETVGFWAKSKNFGHFGRAGPISPTFESGLDLAGRFRVTLLEAENVFLGSDSIFVASLYSREIWASLFFKFNQRKFIELFQSPTVPGPVQYQSLVSPKTVPPLGREARKTSPEPVGHVCLWPSILYPRLRICATACAFQTFPHRAAAHTNLCWWRG